jgi:hypothetical protein
MEFTNIFNRTQMNDPVSTNALQTQTRNTTTGKPTGGFGWVDTADVFALPRQGTAVVRFQF